MDPIRKGRIKSLFRPNSAFGLIALGTAGGFILWRRPDLSSAKSHLILSAIFVLLYSVTYSFLPSLVKAAIALVAIGCALSSYRWGIPFHPGICGLLLLPLPVIPSLQFYLGYPLRVSTGILVENPHLLSPSPKLGEEKLGGEGKELL